MPRALTLLRLAPFGFIAAIGLLCGLGLAGAWAVAQNYSTLSVLLWMLPSIVVGSLFTVYGTALLQSASGSPVVDANRAILRRQGRILFAVFIIFSVTVSVAGFLYVTDLRSTVRNQRLSEQVAIANLKAQQIEKWLVERSIDAQQLAKTIANLSLGDGTPNRESLGFIELLFAEVLAELPDHVAATVFTADGRVIAKAGETVEAPESSFMATGSASSTPRIRERRLGQFGALRLDFAIPVSAGPGRPPLTFVVLTATPGRALLEDFQRWPTDSPTSEVMLVERQDEQAVYVLRPLHASDDRRLSIPLTRTDVAAVQAVLAGDGVRQGIDYRGVPVLSGSRQIAGVGWYVIAKTDVAEALTPIEHRADLVILLTLAAILIAAATSVGLWRADRISYRLLRAQHETERLALSHHYEQMIKHARDSVLLVDDERRIVDANPAAVAAYGYSLDELRHMHAIDLRAESHKAALEANWQALHSSGSTAETVHRRKDGSEFPVEISGSFFEVGGRRFFQNVIRDISERKSLEAEIVRLSRVQSALQSAAGLLLRAKEERELYQGMCDILIKIGSYRLANVALAKADAGKTVEFAAIAGYDEGYLAQARITWGDGPRSKGPTGGAIRTGEVQINHDFATNETMGPWRDEALKRGLRSSIGLPFRADGAVIGALTIYSEQPFAFSKDEVSFLVQFAADMSYGITLLRSRAAA